MLKKTLASLCFFALICGPMAVAQEPATPGMVSVLTVHVELGHQQQFESAIPKLWDAFKKAGAKTPISVSASVSAPGDYTFVVPMSSSADLDTQRAILNQAFAALPAVAAEIGGMTTSTDQSVWALRADLGYTPEKPRLQDSEQAFTQIVFLYPHPAQALAFEAILKEGAALRKKHGIGDGTGVGQMVLGADGPAYAVLIGAKDEADYHVQAAKANEKMGADWLALVAKGGPMLRRIEYSGSMARPALDYQP